MAGVSKTVTSMNERVIEVQREALIKLRENETIGDAVVRQRQRDLDLASMLLDSSSVNENDAGGGMWSPYGADAGVTDSTR
jgi:hypothetical protein